MAITEAAGISEKQRAFVAALVGDPARIVVAAARVAGISNVTGAAWLKKPEIQALIAEMEKTQVAKIEERIAVTAQDIYEELSFIAFSDITELLEAESFELVEGGKATTQVMFRVRNPKTLPTPIRRAIASFRMIKGTNGAPPVFECKMYPKVEALKMLALATQLIPRDGGTADDGTSGFKPNGVKLVGLTLTGPAKGKLQAEGVSNASSKSKAR
jgi:hypothetical protein